MGECDGWCVLGLFELLRSCVAQCLHLIVGGCWLIVC